MKSMKKILSICLALVLVLTCMPAAYAAEAADAIIDENAECSLTIWKYDWTNAFKDGVWTEDSFISTGWDETYVQATLGDTMRQGNNDDSADYILGNGQTSNSYAIKGVGFGIVNVAMPMRFSENENVTMLYAFRKAETADLLATIGLPDGTGRYEKADAMTGWDARAPQVLTQNDPSDYWFYQSDVINKALASALAENSTVVKNALETYITNQAGTIHMDLTDSDGMTEKTGLDVGLYLVVEECVPEMVTSTTNPFFVSLPMTTVSGNEASESLEGGHAWNYDVVVYPKNETGIPSLEKTVRESSWDTGKNHGSDEITDGFTHNATGSGGDVLEYQVISTLPSITSRATALSKYSFYDSISEGLSYNQSEASVQIEFFTDATCTDKVARWMYDSEYFTVSYSDDGRHMTVDITPAGLAVINGTDALGNENINGNVYRGYSNYTMRVSYTATINSDDSFVYGDNGNCNEVVLTWKRTSSEYYDTLIDDCHVYSFAMDLTKLFSDTESEAAHQEGKFEHVKFKIYNTTDGYWVTAALDETTGIYYVTDHVTEEAEATIFTPVASGEAFGKVIVKGMEDDFYAITEVETANGYTLLKDDIHLDIYAELDETRACDVYSRDMLGVLQNDPHYCNVVAANAEDVLKLTNIPQKQLTHTLMSATAAIDDNTVIMLEDNGSENAIVPLTIVNTRGFDLPKTGDNGTLWFTVVGVLVMACAVSAIILVSRKKEEPAR